MGNTASNRFATAITATDDTGPGVKSAGNRFKRLYNDNTKAAKQAAREARKSGFGETVKVLGEFEKASARAFGSRSVLAEAGGRLAGIGQASRFMAGGMARAAAQGGVLSGAMSGLVGIGAGAVGVLVAAGVAGHQLVKGWAANGAQLGRFSQSINVATRDLQAFYGMAERNGVSKEAMGGALGGIGASIHAGIYGQNPEALAALNKLGIPIKRKADGTVDVAAMTYALADATAKIKDPYAQQHLANIFGFQDALPAFRKGGAAMRSDMQDVTRYGGILSDADIAQGTRIERKGVIASQMGGAVKNAAARSLSELDEAGYDRVIEGGRRLGEGAGLFDRTVTNRFTPAVDRLVRAASGPPSPVGSEARAAGGSVRRNNPGNIRPINGVGFNTYATPEAGLAAMSWQLRRYQNRYGLNTVRQVINRWAPPEDHNDTSAYVAAVSRRTGFHPDQHLNLNDPSTLAALQAAMITQEHGRNPFSREQILAQATPGAGTAAPVRHIHEFRGLPQGASVTTRTDGSGDVSIGRAMPAGP